MHPFSSWDAVFASPKDSHLVSPTPFLAPGDGFREFLHWRGLSTLLWLAFFSSGESRNAAVKQDLD
jgi:hypothetical protein